MTNGSSIGVLIDGIEQVVKEMFRFVIDNVPTPRNVRCCTRCRSISRAVSAEEATACKDCAQSSAVTRCITLIRLLDTAPSSVVICVAPTAAAAMTAPLLRAAWLRPGGLSRCLRSTATLIPPSHFLHSSSPAPLVAQAAAANTTDSTPSTSDSSSAASSAPPSSVQSSDVSVQPSQWYPGNPQQLSVNARRRLSRRLRHTDPSRPHLSSFAHLDTTTTPPTLRYSHPAADAKPRKYQLHIPQLHTTFSFRITHAAKEYIQQASEVFEEQALKVNLPLDSIVPLPTRIKRWTLLRSPHVDKQSREQLEFRRHKRLVTLTANTAQQQQQVVKLMHRTTGMINERVTMTMRVPANQPIETMTFRSETGRLLDEAGVKAEAARRTVAGWEDEDEWAEVPYEMEDEVELTEEEENWGEELDLDDDVEMVEAKKA